MAERAAELMEAEAFLFWAEGREGRWELVDGVVHAMAGAQSRHDRIVTNTIRVLGNQLLDGDCRPFTGDTAVRTAGRTIRRADVGVDCGPDEPTALVAADPKLLIEVMSPSNRASDMMRKLDEYRTLPGLDYVLIVEPDVIQAVLWSHEAGGWSSVAYRALSDRIEFLTLGLSISLTDLYWRVTLGPRLVGEA